MTPRCDNNVKQNLNIIGIIKAVVVAELLYGTAVSLSFIATQKRLQTHPEQLKNSLKASVINIHVHHLWACLDARLLYSPAFQRQIL